MPWIAERRRLDRADLLQLVDATMARIGRHICARPRRVLLLPPDITRLHSGSGWLCEAFYERFRQEGATVRVIPTLGQHEPHTAEQNRTMFGRVALQDIGVHDWRGGSVPVGNLPAEEVAAATSGKADWDLPIWLNRELIEQPWDVVLNIGHVVPHEVLGFANHNKNYFIGIGGKATICASHMAAALCGIENNLGTLVTPIRHLFNEAETRFLGHLPDLYVQLVMARDAEGRLVHTGYYAGDDLETYLHAARQSAEENITLFERPVERIICWMEGDSFFSTWVANKAVYRTRMAIADGGELLILAPGLRRFGEQPEVDRLIRRFGYRGTPATLDAWQHDAELHEWGHAAAHLIHGSSEGRFTIRYAPGHLTRDEIESVGYEYADLGDCLRRYGVDKLREGFHEVGGESFFFVATPSIGLWATRDKLEARRAAAVNGRPTRGEA